MRDFSTKYILKNSIIKKKQNLKIYLCDFGKLLYFELDLLKK